MNFTCVNNSTGALEGFCLVKAVEQKTNVKGQAFLDLTLMDAGGEVNAKLWDYRPELHGTVDMNDLVKVRGTLSVYNGQDQFRVERLRKVTEKDAVRMEDFVPSAPRPSEEMLAEILAAVQGFKEGPLKELVLSILDEKREALLFWPAAFRLHHAVRGGLLWHTLSILRLAQAVAALYGEVDADLLLAGVILHDIDKLSEYDVPATGLATGYTLKGNLVGHLVGGAVYIEQKARETGLPEETVLLLQHMLISHHGVPEFGVAKEPLFLEAEILSELDLLDARINEIGIAMQGVQPGEFTNKIWALDNRKFYKPNAPQSTPG
ncbi:MAG: HD domain-containing protein [Oscillospiraceae bacterium]|jgi:3'-5' exoribonuclease|nr:HD domain-containing protein [Oscillospiraceae bacterium]